MQITPEAQFRVCLWTGRFGPDGGVKMNAATVVVGLVVLAVFCSIVIGGIVKRRRHPGACGSCKNCANAGVCHSCK